MRQRSATWQTLAADGEFVMNAVAVINGVEYDTITAPVITNGLLPEDKLSVGNCIAASLKFAVMTTDAIPKSAGVVIKGQLVGDAAQSEWLEFGHYWIDHRVVNDELIEIECFDAMFKGNQPYSDNSPLMIWPKPMTTVVDRIAEQMGVDIDPRTFIKTGADYVVTLPDPEMSCLDILGHIGAVHGGNWTITPEGKLRLVPISSPSDDTFRIIDHSGNILQSDEGDAIVYRKYVADTVEVPVVTGSIETASKYQISRVTMTYGTETTYTAGDDTGFELRIDNNPYATQAICDDLYFEVVGVAYAPYTLTGACFDPAAELGDWVVAGDVVESVLYSSTQTFDHAYRANISSPGEDELDSEYPYVSAATKTQYRVETLTQDNVVMKSEIRQAQGEILLRVSKGEVISSINQTPETIQINASKIDLTGYVTVSDIGTEGQTIINGGNITTGTISDADGNTTFNLETGELNVTSGSIHLGAYEDGQGGTQYKFTVDSEGSLTAWDASILGDITSIDATGDGMRMSSGEIICGEVYAGTFINTYGRIGFYDFSGLDASLGFGISLQGDLMMLESERLYVGTGTGTVYRGWTGTLNGRQFINGIAVN